MGVAQNEIQLAFLWRGTTGQNMKKETILYLKLKHPLLHYQLQQARYRALAAKAINARLLYAPTILTRALLLLSIMFDAYLVDL